MLKFFSQILSKI